MKILVKSRNLLGALLLGLSAGTLHAQLTNIFCGAVSTNADSQLRFVNATNFLDASGFVQMTPYSRIASRYGTNFTYGTTNLVFTALSVKTNSDISAAFGSYLACEVVSVAGPAGATFSFWEQGAGWPTYNFPVGGTYDTNKNRFLLSNCENGAGRPDGDPFGNIRGRRFTVDKAGEYFVTFKLYDISKNHPTQVAAIHAPSDPLTVKFATKVDMDITQIKVTNNVATLTFKQGFLTNMVVEFSTNLVSGNWTVVAGPFTNVPTLTTNVFTNSESMPAIYYRLRGVTP